VSSMDHDERFSSLPPLRRSAERRPPSVGLAMGFGCGGAVFMASLFILGILAFVTVTMRSSEAYQQALTAAQRDPAVVAALGAPVEAGWFTKGRLEVSGATGHASLTIPVTGPRGSGQIDVVADKAAGKWTFRTLSVQVSGGATPLDLLPPAAPTSIVTRVP
jgi:Cytochrome oxidase complex assembly protein 1